MHELKIVLTHPLNCKHYISQLCAQTQAWQIFGLDSRQRESSEATASR